MHINLRLTNGETFEHKLPSFALTVLELKELLASRNEVPPPSEIRLIYRGRVLRNELTLESYGMQSGHVLHLVKARRSDSCIPTSAPNTIPTASQHQAPAVAQPQTAPHPEYIQQMMNSPLMQHVLDNPDLLHSMITSNPQIRALLQSNPELNHALSNPQLLRQIMSASRSPAVMQEMMRNQDRAMANIESMPGGYNALRRLYTDVTEPLDSMTQRSGSSLSSEDSTVAGTAGFAAESALNNADTPSAPTSAPMPNPWTASSPGTSTGISWLGANAAPRRAIHSNRAASTSSNPWAGLGSNSTEQSPVLESVTGSVTGTGSVASMFSMLQDPGMQQIVQQVLSNPATLRELTNHVQGRGGGMLPLHAQQLLQARIVCDKNPEFLRRLGDPQYLQSGIPMQQSVTQLQRAGILPTGPDGSGHGESSSSEFVGNASRHIFGSSSTNTVHEDSSAELSASRPAFMSAEVRFQTQLMQLEEMGFTDKEKNISTLIAVNGNVEVAIARLLG